MNLCDLTHIPVNIDFFYSNGITEYIYMRQNVLSTKVLGIYIQNRPF